MVSVNRVYADTKESMSAETSRQGVDAVEVVGTILQALLRLPRPTRLKELEAATGIAAAKLHRYLVSMIRCGLVSRQDAGNRYDFGLLTYRMGQVATHDHSALSLLEPMFEKFVSELDNPDLGQAIGIGQWVGHGVTIVRWFESNSALSVRMKPGINLSITTSATAKLLAAYLPREKTEALVRKELMERGRATEKEVNRIYAEYADIRERGMASSLSARQSGLNALSVPLFDQQDKVTAAITILGMSPQFEADTKGEAARMLRTLGRDLSAQLGKRSDG
jgi:DNA-binding IclR family transcriptional regulator